MWSFPGGYHAFPIFSKKKLEEDSLGLTIFFSQMVFAECCTSTCVTSNSSVESNPAYLQIATLWLANIMPKIDLLKMWFWIVYLGTYKVSLSAARKISPTHQPIHPPKAINLPPLLQVVAPDIHLEWRKPVYCWLPGGIWWRRWRRWWWWWWWWRCGGLDDKNIVNLTVMVIIKPNIETRRQLGKQNCAWCVDCHLCMKIILVQNPF